MGASKRKNTVTQAARTRAATRRRATRKPTNTHPRAIAFAVATAFLPWYLPQSAYAQTPAPNQMPTLTNTQGQATVHKAVGTYQGIDQYSQRAIYEGSMTMGSNAHLHLQHDHGRAGVGLFKDVSGSLTQIYGRITSNGQVFISNQNGILFGASARVDVGSLFATSLSIKDHDFMAGRYNFYNEGNAKEVGNEAGKNKGKDEGHIITANGYTALVGPQVRNDGVIIARAGSVTLAAGDRVTLDMIGDGLISLSIDQAAFNASVVNKGNIEADGGVVLLAARSANALLDTVINNTGVIRANSLVERNGEIVLDGGNAGVVAVSGTLQAAGVDAGTRGGTVKVLGQYVGLFGDARIDASGDLGGGKVLVGGNYQGKGPEQNATATFVGSGTRIDASAITSGDGGTVVVWSDGSTRAYGQVAARGGANGGDGGLVETSSKQFLDTDGIRVDTRAPNGKRGTWLLDPFDVTIVDGAAGAPEGTAGAFDGGDPNQWVPTGTSTVDDGDIEANLATTDVTILTSGGGGDPGDIFVQNGVSIVIPLLRTLTLDAQRNIDIQGNASITGGLTSVLQLNIGQANAGGTLTVSSGATLPNGVTTGAVNVSGGTGTDRVDVTRDVLTMALTDAALAVGTDYTLNLTSIEQAVLTGGAGDNAITANTFTGTLTVNGTAGTDSVTGNGANTTFNGGNAASTWDTTAGGNNGTYTSGGDTTTLTGVGNWVGGSDVDTFNLAHDVASVSGGAGNDVFNVNASISSSLNGGTNDDSFVFGDTFVLTGGIDGGAGSDTIDWSAYAAGRTVVLTATGATDGFNGTEGSVSGGFSNIDVLTGSAGTDSLTGINAVATWGIDGTNTYSSTNTLSFSSFESLTGGSNSDTFNISGAQTNNLSGGAGADSFVFADAATLTGTIDGDAGSDTLDLSAYTTALTVNLNATGGTDGANGTTAGTPNPVSGGFSNIDVVSGGTNGDTFNINASVTANLSGNGGADSFVVGDTFVLTGTIDGGAGSDTIDWSAYAAGRTVVLTATGTTDGFNGTEASVSGGFSNIDVLTGSAGTDSLTGINAVATWGIDGTNTYSSTNTLSFSSFEGLTGGSNSDTFNISGAQTNNLSGAPEPTRSCLPTGRP